MQKVPRSQIEWFESWIENDISFPEERFEEQQLEIDLALSETAGPDADCIFALYAGYLREEDHGHANGFDEQAGTWHLGRLNYVLFAGTLAEASYAGVDQRWGSGIPFVPGQRRPTVELSYLWTADRSIVLASTADTAVTVIAGPESLAERLLSTPLLRAHVWR